jgi:hypothetical protein
VAADSVDRLPDQPGYGLEKAGESIKRSITGQPDNAKLYEERMDEFMEMARKGKGSQYLDVMSEGQSRLMGITGGVENGRELNLAENFMNRHIRILKNVRENIADENAREGLTTAIQSSERVRNRIREVEGVGPSENIPDAERGRIRETVREEIRNTKEIGPPEETPGGKP